MLDEELTVRVADYELDGSEIKIRIRLTIEVKLTSFRLWSVILLYYPISCIGSFYIFIIICIIIFELS